jgi:hypothetical protein
MNVVTKSVQIQGRTYTTSYPTVGQMIDIQVVEKQLSRGTAKDLLISGMGKDIDAYLYITTFAHMSVLFPTLKSDAKVKTLLDLSLEDFQELVDVYMDEIQPWLQEWEEKIKERLQKATNGKKPEGETTVD